MKKKLIFVIMVLLLSFGHSNAQYGPVVSFTYDDGYPSWYDLGFPLYQQYGFPAVLYINALNSWILASGTLDKLYEMQAAGWEISNHSYDHSGVTEYTVGEMKNWLDSHGFPNSGFAAPGHAWDHEKIFIVKKYHPYYSAASLNPTDVGISTQPLDLYFMRRFPLDNMVSISQVQAVLDDAVQNNRWVIFYGHVLGDTPNSGWEQSPSLLEATFNEVIARQIPVKTVKEVISGLFPPNCVIECAVDSLQEPVLNYFEEGSGSFNTSIWNEYWHNTSWTTPRFMGSPAVYCHTSNDTLPVMKFFRNVPNGTYEVRASILTKDPERTYRLFYSLNDENNPSKDSVEVTKNSEVSLGTIEVTNGQFALYTQKAVAVTGGDGYVGWAFIKLFTQVYANIKVFLQGSYSGGAMTTSLNSSGLIPFHHPYNDTLDIWNYTGSERIYNLPSDIVDWVLVELRTGTESSTTVSKRAALLKSDGSIVDLDGSSQVKFDRVVPGNYYIVVRHRNHLAIMSANPVSLGFTSSSLYDFSTAQTQAYGTEPMANLGGGVFGMRGGDTNGDGIIDAADRSNVWNDRLIPGYSSNDITLDGIVDAADRSEVWNKRLNQTYVP